MKHWLITDTHFNHKEQMMEYCNRPDNYEDRLYATMAEIPPEDVLIHLGDVCIGNDEAVHNYIRANVKCKKWLIKGNHDTKSDSWYLDHGWDLVADAIIIKVQGVHTLLTHKPHPDIGYGINIHGHFHNSDHRRHEPEMIAIKNERQYLLAVEYTDYRAVKAENFIREVLKK